MNGEKKNDSNSEEKLNKIITQKTNENEALKKLLEQLEKESKTDSELKNKTKKK